MLSAVGGMPLGSTPVHTQRANKELRRRGGRLRRQGNAWHPAPKPRARGHVAAMRRALHDPEEQRGGMGPGAGLPGVPRARSGGCRVEGGSKMKGELNASIIDKARKPQGAPKARIKLH